MKTAEERRLARIGRRKLELMDRAEASVYRNVNLANYRAWDFGRYLVSAKQQIGHGIFEQWRKTRFPSVHERKARRCQELFSANANRTELSDFSERVLKGWISGLDQNSVRKFRLGYVPDKHQPNKGMDVKLPRLHSFLNIVNEYERLKYRHTNGLQEVDLLEVREECRDLYDFLAWIYGDRKQSPWEK